MCILVNFKTNIGTEVKVANLKLSSISNLVEQAKKCTSIDAIILFGSSLEERCTEKSDIDIAIISKYTVNGLSNIKSYDKFIKSLYTQDVTQDYDRLYFHSIEEIEKNETLICKELISKGRIIYQKQSEV